jgi:hypothetical protein
MFVIMEREHYGTPCILYPTYEHVNGISHDIIPLCETLTMVIQMPKYVVKVKNDYFVVDCADVGLIAV